jgi:hypothetical protein
MASPEALEVGQRDGAVGHRHLPGADHLVAMVQAAHGAVADGDQEALAGHRRVAQHVEAACSSCTPVRSSGRLAATRLTSRCILGGLPSSTSMGMSMGARRPVVFQHQLALFGGHTANGEALALAKAWNCARLSGAMAST